MTISFEQASAHAMPFGKFRGQTIDTIASSDAGLKYLDWLSGRDWIHVDLRQVLTVYLSRPSIQRDLQALLEKTDE